MPRKQPRWTFVGIFYKCPICEQEGSILVDSAADDDQHFTTNCEHAVPITVEGRINREKRLAAEKESLQIATTVR